jgi:segregation and condensation protein B
MSLKAKLEAVVYAAEEPVTLAQLAAIFADELSPMLDAEAAQLPLNGLLPEVPLSAGAPLATEDLISSEGPQTTEDPSASPAPATPEAVDGASEGPGEMAEAPPEIAPAAGAEAQPEIATAAGAEASAAPETAEPETSDAAAKKLARQRDRRIRLELQKVMDELIAEYAASDRGMEIREIAGGYRMATKPEYHDAVRGFVKSLKPPMKLSLQALETLAVIAYKQPVTAPEVSEIRGVDSGGVLGSLISRKLITTAGRKPVIGRPILYKTTKDFLLCFGLKDVNDLPSMEEFEKMAGELAESEPEQGEVPFPEVQENIAAEEGESHPQEALAETESPAEVSEASSPEETASSAEPAASAIEPSEASGDSASEEERKEPEMASEPHQ